MRAGFAVAPSYQRRSRGGVRVASYGGRRGGGPTIGLNIGPNDDIANVLGVPNNVRQGSYYTRRTEDVAGVYFCCRRRPSVLSLCDVNPLTAEFIYLAISVECVGPINRPTAVVGIHFVKK